MGFSMRIAFCIAFLALAPAAASAECGIASTYSSGNRTANGEVYNHMGVSAAHKTLPFGTRVVVRNQKTGRSIVVRINDRGPFVGGRIIDLSTGAKNALGMGGLAPVCVEVVSYGGKKVRTRRGFAKEAARFVRGRARQAGTVVRKIRSHVRRGVRRIVRELAPHRRRRHYRRGRRGHYRRHHHRHYQRRHRR